MRCILFYVCLCLMGREGLSTNTELMTGTFPYMAFLYYTDDTIMEGGKRFIRNAILIRPNWLVSAAMDVDGDTTFPRKTLVARAGAAAIDVNFTLVEEALQQDREIIKVVQPSKAKMDVWGHDTFLSLLKTMVPFNTTSTVAPTALAEETQDYAGKTCFIVVFGYSNNSEDQVLMKWPIEILPRDSCTTMEDIICSSYNTSTSDDSILCLRNRGGPLVCEETVVGVQSYLTGCQQPHLHIVLAAQRDFIECGLQEQCENNPCNNTCSAYDKDPPTITGALRTTAMTITTTTTPTDPTTEVARRNFVPDVKNETSVAVNESSFEYLKEEIKRTSDIVAANLDSDSTSSAYEQISEFVTKSTSQSEVTPDGTIIILIETPTKTVDLKIQHNSTKVLPNRPFALTMSQASIHVLELLVLILSIFSVIIM